MATIFPYRSLPGLVAGTSCDYPAESQVLSGVSYGNGAYTGTAQQYQLPLETIDISDEYEVIEI